MGLRQIVGRRPSSETPKRREHIPWIESPLDLSALNALSTEEPRDTSESNAGEQIREHKKPHRHRKDSEGLVFKKHDECSMTELFYDLFFVANLATFTANHDITDVGTFKNYLGFFTILWFTWFETTLFDVRFTSDSVFERVCKATSFGVMTGLAATGAEFDTTRTADSFRSFRAMSLILMVSRIAVAAQYTVTVWFLRRSHNAVVSLGLTILVTFSTATVFLGTFFGFHHQNSRAYIPWYCFSCLEAAFVIAIAWLWPVVGFKRTHLVERVKLLSLIIMGEGILGMSKSVFTIFRNSSTVTVSDIGVVIAAVLLIYFIWILYSDQIDHNRFGTNRQLIWAILHFPLHVVILLTVEGSTALILWNIISRNMTWLLYNFPVGADFTNFIPNTFNDPTSLATYLNKTISEFEARFKKNELQETSDYQADLLDIAKITAPFGTTKYDDQAGAICTRIWSKLFSSAFNRFGIEVRSSSAEQGSDFFEVWISYSGIFDIVFNYFYISAGGFLFILSAMYLFGKVHKSKGECVSIWIRILFGVVVTTGLLSDHIGNGYKFLFTPWHIPTVTLTYFIVIILDNFIIWHWNKKIDRQQLNQRTNSPSSANTDLIQDENHERTTSSKTQVTTEVGAIV